MKNCLSRVVGAMMIVAMATAAFAATVTNETDHTYDVYQVFKGTQADGSTELGDIDWGTGVNGSALLTAIKADARFVKNEVNVFADATTAKDVAEILGENTDLATAFANVADQNRTTTKVASVSGQSVTPDLETGYYIFVDTTAVKDGQDAANTALLQVTNQSAGLKIAKKYNVPSFDKDILENDVEVEAADYNIGDTITYELKGTLPDNYADYETYSYIFHDKLSKGQTFNKDVVVKIDGTAVTATVTPNETTDGSAETEITINLGNLKNTAATKDSNIVVTYTATLTADAIIGKPGNPNEAWLEFSNNPNKDGSGDTGTTPHDETLVFTYELDTTKIDGQTKETLKDAEFKLQNAANKYVTVDANGKVTGWVDNANDASVLKSDANGLFKVIGLDAGTYKLTETKAPAGYNLLTDSITLVVEATITGSENNKHDDVTPALTKLTLKVDNEDAKNGNIDNGTVSTNVLNNKGTTLPSTGGIGTTIFYVIGAILVLGAAVLLVTKKRVSAE